MHYRVSIYNYFHRRFLDHGWEFVVRGNELQEENPYHLSFDFKKIDLQFVHYKEEIKKINPSCVIVFLHLRDTMIWPLVYWLKLQGVPIVFWSKALNYDKPKSVVSYILYKYAHSLFDGLIIYSKHEMQHIAKKHWSKVFVASNTVNFNDYPEIKESKEEIKRELGVSFEKIVLSVGRMGVDGGRKKLDHLIEIFNGEMPKGVGLVVVGSGVGSEHSQKMNKANMLYLGQLHDSRNIKISKVFKMADVFSIPGHVGLGLNQALYWGLPVVTEEGSQPPEIAYLIHGRNGFIVPNNDIQELKRKILYLLENDEIREKFSRDAKRDILASASIENMFEGFRQCVEHVHGQNRQALGETISGVSR
jgi:glycosyltransferase involved in cell wall biosynthesis